MSDFARMPAETETAVTPLRPLEEPRAPSAAVVRLRQSMQQECEVMLQYALDKATPIPPQAAQKIDAVMGAGEMANFAVLAEVHGMLAALITPACGRTLVLLKHEREAHPILYMFGPVRLMRQMLGFAVLALIFTSVLSTLDIVDVDNVAKGWFGLSGLPAYGVLAFLLSVAALGAAFSNLSMINRYIEHANYNPTFEGSYWVRIVLGLISGVVLGEILFDLVARDVAEASGLAPAGERIVLAFLGGFATAPVQRLLTNLSDAVGTLLQGRSPPPAAPAASDKPARDAR